VARVCREAYPDPSQWDQKSEYFDTRATKENPWPMVDVEFVERFPTFVTMDSIKARPELENMILLHNTRLSVQPLTAEQFEIICQMGRSVVTSQPR
jgi:predicted RNA-binding protein with PUA-like domain